MISNRRLQATLLCVAALAGGLAACGKIEDNAAALEASKITMAQAVKAAKTKIDGGVPLEVELELFEGKPRYNVELATGDNVTAVAVDAVSGEVLETTEVIPDPEEKRIIEELLELSSEQRVGLVGALKKALKKSENGRPLEVDLEDEDGTLIFSIRLLVGNLIKNQTIEIAKQ